MVFVNKNEPTAARRRVYFHLVDATDGMTPETGEAGGQPQISIDGGAWTDVGIGVLVHIGYGRYYAELTQVITNVDDALIETRYKSANTAECPGDSVTIGLDTSATVDTTAIANAVVAQLPPPSDGVEITPATLDTGGDPLGVVMPFGEVTVYLGTTAMYQFDADADGDYAYKLPAGSVWRLVARRAGYVDSVGEVSTVA